MSGDAGRSVHDVLMIDLCGITPIRIIGDQNKLKGVIRQYRTDHLIKRLSVSGDVQIHRIQVMKVSA